MSRDNPIKDLCELMVVSRAGYYKWLKHKPTIRDHRREEIVEKVKEVHEKHRTHGYRWTAAFIRINMHLEISDSYAYKCFRYLGIKAETKHRIYSRPRKVKDKYPNLIYSTWETVDRPKQVIVSDMTMFRNRYTDFEVTFYFDVYTKEILTYRATQQRGDRMQYIDGLNDVIGLLKGSVEPVVLHTDQGSVYASMAYNDLIKDTNIVRSMSRAGKPTDNPVNEALNGWIKEELTMDFGIDRVWGWSNIIAKLDEYIKFYNEQRPCFAIGYETPDNYRKRYYKGELPRKNSFESRELSTEPKFVKERRKKADNEEDT